MELQTVECQEIGGQWDYGHGDDCQLSKGDMGWKANHIFLPLPLPSSPSMPLNDTQRW